MDKALNLLSLSRKAGLCELGEEPVGVAARALHAHLIIVARDASDHTWRRAKSFVAGTSQQAIRLPHTKDELGLAVGRTSLAIAAFTDVSLSLAFLKALPEQEKHADILEALQEQEKRQKQRQKEAKAHKRNVKTGKK